LQEISSTDARKRAETKINIFINNPKISIKLIAVQQKEENDGTQYGIPPMSAVEIYKIKLIKVKPARQLLVLIWQAG
jgi:hypothetical protein